MERSREQTDEVRVSRGTGQALREQAESLVEALNARDFEAIARMPWLEPDFEFHSALSAIEGRHHLGASGLRDWAKDMDAVWLDFRVQITDLRELEDGRVVVIYRATGRGRGSGMPLDTQTAQIWSFRDGKLWHNQSFTDPAEALEAVGLRE